MSPLELVPLPEPDLSADVVVSDDGVDDSACGNAVTTAKAIKSEKAKNTNRLILSFEMFILSSEISVS